MESQIISFASAAETLSIDPQNRPDFSMLPEPQKKAFEDLFEMDIITRALNNEGLSDPWVRKPGESQYTPIFYFSPGSGWSCHDCADWHTYSIAGARPFRNYEIMRFATETFKGHYNNILNYFQSKNQ